jgi:hypothetical protein
MTDKELLELAAKAAGITLANRHYKEWNPLLDDGDAFRLAVKLNLRINVDFDTEDNYVKVYSGERQAIEDDECNPYLATRRAIVRAAAKIGKQHYSDKSDR